MPQQNSKLSRIASRVPVKVCFLLETFTSGPREAGGFLIEKRHYTAGKKPGRRMQQKKSVVTLSGVFVFDLRFSERSPSSEFP